MDFCEECPHKPLWEEFEEKTQEEVEEFWEKKKYISEWTFKDLHKDAIYLINMHTKGISPQSELQKRGIRLVEDAKNLRKRADDWNQWIKMKADRNNNG